MYDDYREYYYVEQPSSLSDGMGGAMASVFAVIISFIVGAVGFVFMRFDILSSAVIGALSVAFVSSIDFDGKMCVGIFLGVFLVSLFLQHKFVIARFVIGFFASVVVSVLATIIIGYDTNTKMYMIMGCAFIITILWGVVSWRKIVV